jgi:hypothetical protein
MSGQDGKGTNFPHGIAVGGQTLALAVLNGSATIDPISLIDAAGATSTITVTGVVLGKYAVDVIAPYDLQGLIVTGYVSAANTVAIRIQNETGGTIDLVSGTWRVQCRQVVA